MNRLLKCGAVLLCATFLLALLDKRGEAVPAFARRIGAKCSQCHFIAGELNLTGKDFLRRGLREFEEVTPDVQPGVTTAGAESASESSEPAGAGAEPQTGVERRLQQLEQEMARMRAGGQTGAGASLGEYLSLIGKYGFESEKGGTSRFGPGELALWSGGPLSPEFSYVAEVEAAVGATSDESELETEEFYGQYTSGVGANYTTIRFGSFQPILLTTHQSGAPRIILERPAVLSGRSGNGNGWRPRSRLRGVEAGILRGNFAGYLGIGNGQGQNTGDSHMDFYGTLERTFDDNGSSLGLWAFSGDTPLTGIAAPPDGRDRFKRWGILGNYAKEKTKVVGAFLKGTNESAAGDLDNDGFFLQVLHLVSPDAAVYARWDDFQRDLAAGGQEETDGITVGGRWWMSSQFGFTAEAGFLETNGDDDKRFALELIFGF